MDAQDFRSLQEAYMEVVEKQQLDELAPATSQNIQRVVNRRQRQFDRTPMSGSTGGSGAEKAALGKLTRAERLAAASSNRRNVGENYDIFDAILEHLVAEGYADTNKAALAIMANMSEEWRESIVEEVLDEALTGKRLERAQEIIARDPKSPKAKAVKRVADSQEGSDRGDTTPGDLPRNRNQPGGNTTLPTRRGGSGRKGQGKTVNRPPHGAPLGARTGESDRGRRAFG